MDWVVKLTKQGDQYRITLPKALIKACGLEEAEFVRLGKVRGYTATIEEYYGKGKEKRDLPKDKN